MAELDKADSSTGKAKGKTSFLDEDFSKDFLSSWKSMSVAGGNDMDFNFEPVTKGKKAFDFAMDMDFSLDDAFGKMPSFKLDMPDIDFSSSPKKSTKEKSEGESAKGSRQDKHDDFNFSFNFNRKDDFSLDAPLSEKGKDSSKERISKQVSSAKEIECEESPVEAVSNSKAISKDAGGMVFLKSDTAGHSGSGSTLVSETSLLESASQTPSKSAMSVDLIKQTGPQVSSQNKIAADVQQIEPETHGENFDKKSFAQAGASHFISRPDREKMSSMDDFSFNASLSGKGKDSNRERISKQVSSAKGIECEESPREASSNGKAISEDAVLMDFSKSDAAGHSGSASIMESEPSLHDSAAMSVNLIKQTGPQVSLENKVTVVVQGIKPDSHGEIFDEKSCAQAGTSHFSSGPDRDPSQPTALPRPVDSEKDQDAAAGESVKNSERSSLPCSEDQRNSCRDNNLAGIVESLDNESVTMGSMESSVTTQSNTLFSDPSFEAERQRSASKDFQASSEASLAKPLVARYKLSGATNSKYFMVRETKDGDGTVLPALERNKNGSTVLKPAGLSNNVSNVDRRMKADANPSSCAKGLTQDAATEESENSTDHALKDVANNKSEKNRTEVVVNVRANKLPSLPSLKFPRNVTTNKQLRTFSTLASLKPMGNFERTAKLQKEGQLVFPVNSLNQSETLKQQSPSYQSSKRKHLEAADSLKLHPSKRLSPIENRIPNVSAREGRDGVQTLGTSAGASKLKAGEGYASPKFDFHQEAKMEDLGFTLMVESDANVEKAEACAKELDDICNMLRKKHEEAKELLVRALVNNNNLLMLNHPMCDEKIRSVQKFATRLMCREQEAGV